MNKKILPIIIAGPTASGKTDIALALAGLCGGEIISADSRQVYKSINIGTAAPQGVWSEGVYKVNSTAYHLVDFLDLNESFDVSQFCSWADKIVAVRSDTQFIFAGGTGMYMQGYFAGMDALPGADQNIRSELSALAEVNGKEYLHKLLASFDAVSAGAIPAGNIHRVIRAIELHRLTGTAASVLRTGKFGSELPQDKVFSVYIDWDRALLEKRIQARTNLIFEPMVKEAQEALKLGYAKECNGLRSLGFREAIEYLDGKITRAEALERIAILTRQYAKRQRTWFKRYKNIRIINPESFKDASSIAKEILLWKEQQQSM